MELQEQKTRVRNKLSAARAGAAVRRQGPGRLSAEDAAELPDRLLDAAFEMFAERGYGDATMDQIAKRAGASTKTLYSRFANKAEILEAVVRRNVERATNAHLRALNLDPATMEPRAFLIAFGRRIANGGDDRETVAMSRITYGESYRFPVLRKLYHEVNGRGVRFLENALKIWRDQGRITLHADPHQIAGLCFVALIEGPRTLWVLGTPMGRREVENHVDVAVAMILGSLDYKEKAAAPAARKKRG